MQAKPRVILDSSVVVSGIGWRGGDARKVLTLLAVGGFQSYRTPWITAEWAETVQYVAQHEKRWKNPNWINWLEWVKRDPNDDPVVMAAVSARASYIVTTDEYLLCLEKPYGIACVTPREFLAVILRQH